MKSSFTSDLGKEKRLTSLLDSYYSKYLKNYNFERVNELKKQLQGVDVMFQHSKTKKTFLLDEKAQLDYVNEDLPTFAFELLYSKDGVIKEGWFLDQKKKTDFYSLVTAIYEDEPLTYTSCKVTFVNREVLVKLLKNRGVTKDKLIELFNPNTLQHGKKVMQELNPKTEGYLYFSKNNKAEKPFNLILRLDFLLTAGVAKRLF